MEAPLLLPVSTAASSSSTSITVDDDSPPRTVNVSPFRASPSGRSIAARYLAVALVAAVSLFAQHETSKGFRIDVVSAAPRDGTAAARRFDLLFVANGRAERVLHRASRRVEEALFPDASFPRRRVARVTVRLMAGGNLTADDATVDATAGGEYVISLSPRLLSSSSGSNVGAADAVAAAVRRAVARMWLWDGRGAAPARVTESMVEYLASGDAEGLSPAENDASNTQCISPRFLKHLERRRAGFVARLNRAMRDRWSDAAVDAALGAPVRPVCAAYLAAATETGGQRPVVGSTVAV